MLSRWFMSITSILKTSVNASLSVFLVSLAVEPSLQVLVSCWQIKNHIHKFLPFWRASEQQLSWITEQKSVTLSFRCLNRFSRWDFLEERNQEHPQARAAGVILDNGIEIHSLSVAISWQLSIPSSAGCERVSSHLYGFANYLGSYLE